MNSVRILRRIDAMATQQRIIFHLACGHNGFINERDLLAEKGDPAENKRLWLDQEMFDCKFCPDPPKVEEKPGEVDVWEAYRKAAFGDKA